MPSLTVGTQSPLAALWNRFLHERGLTANTSDTFDADSKQGTRRFQQWLIEKNPGKGIQADGHPGNQTLGYACGISGSDWMTPGAIADAVGIAYPPRDATLPKMTSRDLDDAFGEARWIAATQPPVAGGPIKFTNSFDAEHIGHVKVPQLIGITGAPASGTETMNKAVMPQLCALWAAWERQGILRLITGYAGLWVPRFVRGSTTVLSNHARGTAFDINASANWLSHLPAFPGENGSLFKHVPIAQDYGFSWGGHYAKRLDGMHFEALKVLSAAELSAANAKYGVA